jgi:hypothetical protein
MWVHFADGMDEIKSSVRQKNYQGVRDEALDGEGWSPSENQSED